MMPLTQEELGSIENRLEQIYARILADIPDASRAQIREYIDVAEYGLALDEMAHVVLARHQPVTADLRWLFDKAADMMAIKPGDGWSAVDDLRATV